MVTGVLEVFQDFGTEDMPTFRCQHNTRYTQISNDLLQSRQLTLTAKGLLVTMLSYPDNWEFNERYLISHCIEGRHAIRKAIQELIAAGYIHRDQTRIAGKFGQASFIVYEFPVKNAPTVDRFSDDGFSDDGFSDDGFSDDGFSDVGKSDNILINISTNECSGLRNEGTAETANAAPTPTVPVEVLPPEAEPQGETSASLVKQEQGLSAQRESGVGTESSAAPRRAKKTPIDEARWIEAYNAHKPDKWAQCMVLNDKRRKAIAKAITELGEDKSIELLAAGLSHLRTDKDPWWRDRGMDIDNCLADLRFIGWGEAGLSAGINPAAVANSGLSDSQIQAGRREKEAGESLVVRLLRENRRRKEEAAAKLRGEAV